MRRNACKLGAIVLLAVAVAGGCTAVDVKPLDSSVQLDHVCIELNSRVQVSDFVSVLEDGFERHGISTQVVSGDASRRCEFVLYYTALRSWDLKPYLSVAELRLRQNRQLIASADYHLRGKGGLSVMKWNSTESKIGPVIDKLLANVEAGEVTDAADEEMIPNDIFDKIVALEERRRSGAISDAEFEQQKRHILEQM